MQIRNYHIVYTILSIQFILIGIIFYAEFFPTENSLKKDYYRTEVATLISPHGLREQILHNKNNFVLVDTRDNVSYIDGHIVGAINIEPNLSIVSEFQKLQEMYPDKPILIYCYTQVCLRGRKIGKELANHNIYVFELGIGFNEWKNFWRQWNYESEWDDIDIFDYIAEGEDPGVFKNTIESPISNCNTIPGFSC